LVFNPEFHFVEFFSDPFRIPDECGGMQICSKSGICEATECSTDEDCEAKTDHPVK